MLFVFVLVAASVTSPSFLNHSSAAETATLGNSQSSK
jgi:hypothetical protein